MVEDNKFKALGKGLSSLIPNKLDFDVSNFRPNYFVEISIDKIVENIDQPRKNFNKEDILELAKSIKLHGVLQPILVKKFENDKIIKDKSERRAEQDREQQRKWREKLAEVEANARKEAEIEEQHKKDLAELHLKLENEKKVKQAANKLHLAAIEAQARLDEEQKIEMIRLNKLKKERIPGVQHPSTPAPQQLCSLS